MIVATIFEQEMDNGQTLWLVHGIRNGLCAKFQCGYYNQYPNNAELERLQKKWNEEKPMDNLWPA